MRSVEPEEEGVGLVGCMIIADMAVGVSSEMYGCKCEGAMRSMSGAYSPPTRCSSITLSASSAPTNTPSDLADDALDLSTGPLTAATTLGRAMQHEHAQVKVQSATHPPAHTTCKPLDASSPPITYNVP